MTQSAPPNPSEPRALARADTQNPSFGTHSQAIGYELPAHLKARRVAQRREWTVQAVALCLTAAGLAGAGLLLPSINELRRDHQLVIDPENVSGLPPDIALLGKLGTFRALAIDWASIRAERLKEEGKTYEALQLHEAVCALAPRFPSVWIYAAWNMAYNISVLKYTPEERWQWVTNGIEILRDRGLKYNPQAVPLYKELAWIYWHKIGDFLDDEHLNYKRAFAVEMQQVLGPPPIALTDREYFDWFRPIAEAPHDLEDLIARDAGVGALSQELAAVGLPADLTLLEFVARHTGEELRVSELLLEGPQQDPLVEKRLALLRDPQHQEALHRLLAAVRSKVLRERYKLDPQRMLDLMADSEEGYGPLDWRNAFTHSLYWSKLGDEIGEKRRANTPNEKITNARFVFYSLHKLITKGRMALRPDYDDPFFSYIEFTPDLRLIPYLFETYMRLGEKHFKDDPRYEKPPGPVYKTGLVSAMHDWIQLLYLEGGEGALEQAENYYAWLRENNPHPDGTTQERYLQALDQFVIGEILEQLKTYKAALPFIQSFILRALKHWSLGQDDQALAVLWRGRKCYEFWMIDTRRDPNDRRKMQPFRIILRDTIEHYMQLPDVLPYFKARLWRALEREQQRMVYDRLRPYFERLCAALDPPWDVNKAFPEPPGMEQFREQEIEYRGAPRRKDAELGERHKQ